VLTVIDNAGTLGQMPDETITISRMEWESLLGRVAALEQVIHQTKRAEIAVQETPKPVRTRGARLTEGWEPSEETVYKMVNELNVTSAVLHREHLKFVDYFMSAPGQKGVKTDWNRAWCNWMRSAAERGSLRGGASSAMDQKVSGWRELGRAASGE
jgi:hypothetical protein